MARRKAAARHRRRRAVALLVLLLAIGAAAYPALRGGSASGAVGAGSPYVQTGAPPAQNVIMFGASPAESPGETWGVGEIGSKEGRPVWGIVRYSSTQESWSLEPAPLSAGGSALEGFAPDRSVLAGSATPQGDVAILGKVTTSEGGSTTTRQALLSRNPGGPFREAAAVPAGLLKAGEALFSAARSPLLAAQDEGGHAGVLVVPVLLATTGAENGVLHWDGHEWTREAISPAPEGLRVLAITVAGSRAWLLAQLPNETLALYYRDAGSEPASWKPFSLTAGHSTSEPQAITVPVASGSPAPFAVSGEGQPPSATAQLLTSTSEGLWIDGRRTDDNVDVTMYLKAADATSGTLASSWCEQSGESSSCTHPGAGAPPTGNYRSYAWADPSQPFGQRVTTGFGEGTSLRLTGTEFEPVLALGGANVGSDLGAAFSTPSEGWLGAEDLPVHLAEHPAPTRLTNYPTPFRRALVAVAPQPGAPIGATGSGAVAVGDSGEVARWVPGEGWQPESLIGAGGRIVTPRLRSVAWPTPNRVYAVGDEGEMWLWRGETGLWEPDPAKPLNFVSNLLSIAFQPGEPNRGYAVGQSGALLAYGKSWTQEPLPPEAAGASFTSVAFAGSEAIAAFRQPHQQAAGEPAHYTSGILVNEGSGWHLDSAATEALSGTLPWAVAGLPDGGAAVSAENGAGQGFVIEREGGPGSPWHATAPYPGVEAAGSLALFREGGALRAVGSGHAPKTLLIDTDERPPPAGFPPNFVQPYPLQSGYLMRQTATGWSDEQPDRNFARDPEGEYKFYDSVYNPDPVASVLIDAEGNSGWAVGGVVDNESRGRLDTSDVSRYAPRGGTEGVQLPGYGQAPITAEGESSAAATFAIGGNAACAAPCAARALAKLGPDAWLSTAVARAQTAGARAFLYTGPRVTTGVGHGPIPVPWANEYHRYAELLAEGATPTFTPFAVATFTDRGPGNECEFEAAFGGFPSPFGKGVSMEAPSRSSEPCAAPGAQSGYYAFDSAGAGQPTVRVIMLDASSDPGPAQVAWVRSQLAGAAAASLPAIVIGNADLRAGVTAGNSADIALVNALNAGHASAYFYDAPEENVQGTLPGGTVPSFGTGTLGYVSTVLAEKQDFHGHSGILLAQVGLYNARTGTAPVTVHLIPVIGELAMEAKDGVLLRRSTAALFAGLARRPRSGGRSSRGRTLNESATYTPVPAECVGSACANAILPEYTFSSSHPGVGDFVERNTASPESHAVLLGAGEKPIHDSHSGLFCAYNPGTTEVTITSGGFRATLVVTVQAGSVRRPCGTVPAENVAQQQRVAPPPPAPSPTPSSSPPAALPPLIPVPAPPAAVVPPAPPVPTPVPTFIPPAVATSFLVPFVPLPLPTPGRPTPPSGTSPVTQPVEAPEREEEFEEAPDTVGNKAVAYDNTEHEPLALYVLGAVVLAALAGASIRRPRHGRRGVRVAPATLNTLRSQQRMDPRRRR